MRKLPIRARLEIVKNELFKSKSVGGFSSSMFSFQSGQSIYSSQSSFLRAYSNLPWLRAGFGKVADGVAAAPWYMEEIRKDKKAIGVKQMANTSGASRERMRKILKSDKSIRINLIHNHPMLELMSSPNAMMTQQALMSLTCLYVDLVGESIWYIVSESNGLPSEILPVPPSWIQERPNKKNGMHFLVKIDSDKIPKKIHISDTVWFRSPDLENPYSETVGTATALADELESDEYATHHIKSFFLNRARPDIIISGTGLNQTETEEAEERWLSKFRGFWKAHRPAFFSQDVKVLELNNKFKDMELIALRKWQRDIVLQAIGMPPEILGVLESSNRATIDTAAFIFAKWVLTPRLEVIRATLQAQLVPRYDHRIVLEYASPVEEDREFALKVRIAAPWAFTIDQWREVNGDNPLEDGQGEVVMIPAGMQPVKVSEITQFVSPYANAAQNTIDNAKKSA